MIAIEIRINGELKATCGADDLMQLVAMIRITGKLGQNSPKSERPSYILECMGIHEISNKSKEILKWVGASISQGDDVSFKFKESSKADKPINSQVLSKHVEI